MADTHTYDHSDIQRYLQQQMTAKEKHAFEKAMMDDPFLADALEGFRNSDASVANLHLLEIEQEVRGTKESGKIVPVVPVTKRWWRIAALFMVIAGTGLITYQLLNKTSRENEIAAKVDMRSLQRADTLRPAGRTFTQPESFKDEPGKTAQNAPVIVQKPTLAIKETNDGLIASSKRMKQQDNESSQLATEQKSEAAPANAASLSAPAIANESVDMSSRDILKQSRPQRFEGQVVDTKGKPVAGASVTANNLGTLTDSNGNFSITSPDTAVEVNASFVGYAPAIAKISKEKANKIVLNESNLALNDVVVTGYGARRNKNQVGYPAPAVKPGNVILRVEPESGSESFNRYVNAALKTIKDTATSYVSGDVQLEFTVNGKGDPVEIKVINPNTNNAAMQAKAIELLQKGPRWKPVKKNQKATVTIHF